MLNEALQLQTEEEQEEEERLLPSETNITSICLWLANPWCFNIVKTTNFRPNCMPRVKYTTQESDCLFSEVFEMLLKLVFLSCVMCPLELNWTLLGTWIWWQQSTKPVCTSAGWWTKSSELPARWEPDGELVSIHDQPSN